MEFGHHPEPATDFCVEVEAIEAEITDLNAGLPATMDLGARIERAMQFKVGGDAAAVVAKADLRKIEAAFKAGRAAGVPGLHPCGHMKGSCQQCHQCLRDQGATSCPTCEPAAGVALDRGGQQ
jgi:hypothetical protein